MAEENKEYPKRAHYVEINAGADTQEDLIAALHDILYKMRKGTQSSITGGSSAGYYFKYEINPDMTRAKYLEEIEKANSQFDQKQQEVQQRIKQGARKTNGKIV